MKKYLLMAVALLMCIIVVFAGSLHEKQEVPQMQECQHEWKNSGGEIGICTKCGSSQMASSEDIVHTGPGFQNKEIKNPSMSKEDMSLDTEVVDMKSGETYIETLSGDWSSVQVAVGGTGCYPWIFDEAVKDCTEVTMHFQITEVYYGKVYGTYGLYHKTLNDNWERVATFAVSDQSEIIKTFEFDDPISFTALAVAAPSGRNFNFDTILWFEDWYLQD